MAEPNIQKTSSDQYRCNIQFMFPAGNKTAVSCSILKTPPLLIDPILVKLILNCSSFKTLEEHARKSWKSLSLLEKINAIKPITDQFLKYRDGYIIGLRAFEKMLAGIFESLAQEGLFVARKTFIEWANGVPADNKSPAAITSLGIVTSNRPQALKRSLESYLENCRLFNRHPNFVIADDTKNESTIKLNKETVQDLGRRYNCNPLYCGKNERETYIKFLVKSGIPEEVIRFAFGDFFSLKLTHGANRNSLLLDTIGEMGLSVDDDTCCRIGKSPHYESGIKFGSGKTDFNYWAFKNRLESFNEIKFENQDLLALHESLLGKTLGHVFTETHLENVDLTDMPSRFTSYLENGEGRIRLTFNGLVGDSGSGLPFYFLFLEGPERDRLLKTEGTYRTAFRSRAICKAASKFFVDISSGSMTTFFGFDNRDVLPPFFPFFRNEDYLFGEMLRFSERNGLTGILPWVLVHDPIEERFYSDSIVKVREPLTPELAIRYLMKNISDTPKLGQPGAQLRYLGETLIKLSSVPAKEFQRVMAEHFAVEACHRAQEFETLLTKHKNSPKYWKKDVQALIMQSHETIQVKTQEPSFADINMNREEYLQNLQKMVRKYGELLVWWENMTDVARDLKNRGIRLAQPLN